MLLVFSCLEDSVSHFFHKLIAGTAVAGDSLDTDREVLLELKSFLEHDNPVNPGLRILLTSSLALTALSFLDLSWNTFGGAIPIDLSNCQSLVYLNLSHNILEGELNLTALSSLEILDLSVNRIFGEIQFSFPTICHRLIVANISANNLDVELIELKQDETKSVLCGA
ncbi:hypothetical protein Tsubulata_015030 [Turnera subulata]|uniref:Uncharacterized protein n=1 Tax=Turnera subulata TaxID=218843 RepID=A0A9Q0J1Y1_9ROSI|nr:hypothetical protein Tsubulata_015030 [Turnera subulata]